MDCFFLWWFCSGLASNACFLVTGRVPVTELYARFWDGLKTEGVLISFEKLLNLGF